MRSSVSKRMARTISGASIAEVIDGHPAKVQALIAAVHGPAIRVTGHCIKPHCLLVPGVPPMVGRGQEVVTVYVITIILPGRGLA